MTREDPTLEDIRRALASLRPGLAAHREMDVHPLSEPESVTSERPAREGAVLLLLYVREARLTFVLTRRTETVLTHKGQISFPGGAKEEEDASLAATALREAQEELGIELVDAEMLGDLTSLYIPRSNYDIHPYVAYEPARPVFRPAPAEVAEILEIPLADLLDPGRRQEEVWTLRGRPYRVPFFLLAGQKVWGATGMVLNEFRVMLENVLA